MRPWTVLSRRPDAALLDSFNGATALRPWTVLRRMAEWAAKHELQWGHGLAAVDGRQG